MGNEKIVIREYVKKDSKLLSERPNGEKVREQLKLNQKDKDPYTYEIVIDNDFTSLNSSFWLGMFGESVRTLNEEKFREKYIFKCKDVFLEKIDACIEIALAMRN